jgi:hypothetical protein
VSRPDLHPGDLRLAARLAAGVLILAAVYLVLILGALAMKRLTLLSAAAIAALGLSSCGTAGVGGADLLKQLASDPNCAHHDEAEVIVGAGGVPGSAHVKVSRDCPARPPATATP